MAMIMADVDSNGTRLIVALIQMLANMKQGTATAEEMSTIETVEHLVGVGNPEQITHAN
jgi:5S rRNA maturation endonuclease (ribonuclease M5)